MKTEKDYLREIAENTAKTNEKLDTIKIILYFIEALAAFIFFAVV